MHRSAPRLSRILACAAVPLMLVAVGCSSDSGSGSGAEGKKNAGSSSSGTGSTKPTKPAVEPAKFTDLPDACTSIAKKTIAELVPEAKKKGGTAGRSSDLSVRGSCSWNGLDDKGVKGSQYRWLDLREEPHAGPEPVQQGEPVQPVQQAADEEPPAVPAPGPEDAPQLEEWSQEDNDFADRAYEEFSAYTDEVGEYPNIEALDIHLADRRNVHHPRSTQLLQDLMPQFKDLYAQRATADQSA
ncbi:hypothetical protein SMICM304S_09340 [Streptomyces microflavus]